jgi:hypothetical protein
MTNLNVAALPSVPSPKRGGGTGGMVNNFPLTSISLTSSTSPQKQGVAVGYGGGGLRVSPNLDQSHPTLKKEQSFEVEEFTMTTFINPNPNPILISKIADDDGTENPSS